MAVATKSKRKAPAAKLEVAPGTTTARCIGISNGKTVFDQEMPQAGMLKLVKGLPAMMAQWKAGAFRIMIEGEIIASKKGRPKKAAPAR
jgi:hypothetical protein